MSRLTAHENVMNISGYGWNVLHGSYIPFIVTEYAEF